jgi:hypothetical protein
MIKSIENAYPTTDLEQSLSNSFTRHAIEIYGILMRKGMMTVLLKRQQTLQLNDLDIAVREAMRAAGISNRENVLLQLG